MRNESRSFLVNWFQTQNIPLTRIEDVGKGVAICMLFKSMDSSFPNFKKDPSNENDFFYNLKLVAQYFDRKNIKIKFPMDKMVKLKMQDNLEFAQILYKFLNKESSKDSYAIDSQSTEREPNIYNSPKREYLSNSNLRHELIHQVDMLREQNKELHGLADKLKECASIMQSERDFYYDKLVQVERILKEIESDEMADVRDRILKVLYKN